MKLTGKVSGNRRDGFAYEIFHGGYAEDLGEPLKSETGFKVLSDAYTSLDNYINNLGAGNEEIF